MTLSDAYDLLALDPPAPGAAGPSLSALEAAYEGRYNELQLRLQNAQTPRRRGSWVLIGFAAVLALNGVACTPEGGAGLSTAGTLGRPTDGSAAHGAVPGDSMSGADRLFPASAEAAALVAEAEGYLADDALTTPAGANALEVAQALEALGSEAARRAGEDLRVRIARRYLAIALDTSAGSRRDRMYQRMGEAITAGRPDGAAWYEPRAEQGGRVEDAYVLGRMYFEGAAVGQDDGEAVRWYRRAADQGYARAQANLGYMYEYGLGVTQGHVEAARWYREAAVQGFAPAQASLGYMYANGHGVSNDDDEAVRWYRRAADQGDTRAQTNLGWMHENGRGVTQGYGEAVQWYRGAADQDYTPAQASLGYMYEYGLGVVQDYGEAMRWYRRAADQGNARAQFNIGEMYAKGHGVTRDCAAARVWYQKAADQGHETAQANSSELDCP